MELFTFEQLQEVTTGLRTVDVKGKDYTMVNERIKAFRQLLPTGSINTDVLYMDNGMVVMKAKVMYGDLVLSDGIAYEREGTTNINKTSYIENCQTSAIGRALAFLGIGIDLSIASAEEVSNAIEQQTTDLPISEVMVTTIQKLAESVNVTEEQICKRYKVKELKEIKAKDFASVMNDLKASAK